MKDVFFHENMSYEVDHKIKVSQEDPDFLELLEDFECMGEVIPKGFRYDGASSPAFPLSRFICPKYSKNMKAACLHDWLCRKAKTHEERKEADFKYLLMKRYVEHEVLWKCKLSYYGVRIGDFLGIGNNF